MDVKFSSFQEYREQYLTPNDSCKEKVSSFFSKAGYSKIMIIVGAILVVVGTIVCGVQGLPPMSLANLAGITQLVGVVLGVIGLVGVVIQQASIISRFNKIILTEGK